MQPTRSAKKPDCATGLAGRTDGAASVGNDGLYLATDTRVFAARAGIFAAASVPNASAGRLRPHWAVVEDACAIYEASMVAAADAAARNDWMLVSESSWPSYVELSWHVIQGYLMMIAEVIETIREAPTHIVLRANVGVATRLASGSHRHALGLGPDSRVLGFIGEGPEAP